MGDEDPARADPPPAARRPYWRSQSWSASRTPAAPPPDPSAHPRRLPAPPLTPRSHKARSSLPPLQPLAIARRSVDEWPRAGSDDLGEWAPPLTPGARPPELKVDISVLRTEGIRSQMALFDKECSKVAEHIYLGGDAVARDREILRRHGITHVLNCVGFVCPEYFKSDLVYRTLWLQDSPSEDITSILYDVFDYFEDVRENHGRVLVHCCQGVSRSTSLVIAYLMWREGQSFEDAFEFVKAARGIANPNMGFACQLLQCQKRVHAIPLSPNSLLRMYRMAPHSPYDALHLVPKMLGEPSPSALDSRGAFIVQVPWSIYIWIGKKCEAVMERDAKAAAHQVVRYEKVPGPIVTVEEGGEPPEFWDIFSGAAIISDIDSKIRKGIGSGNLYLEMDADKRKVEAYDTDFGIFYKGLCGGVLPAGAGRETHIPARESDWSILRWKFVSPTVVSGSKAIIAKDSENCLDRVLFAAIDHAAPLDMSPSNSSSYSLDPLEVSTSMDLKPPAMDSLHDMVPSSRGLQKSLPSVEPSKFSLKAILSPSKRFGRSLAERRGGSSPSLKLSTAMDQSPQSCSNSLNVSSNTHSSEGLTSDEGNLKILKRVPVASSTCNSSDWSPDLTQKFDYQKSMGSEQTNNSFFPMAYSWPDSKKIEPFSRDDLDSLSVFLILVHDRDFSFTSNLKSYLWIGSNFMSVSGHLDENGNRNMIDVKHIDWDQVGRDILKSASMPTDIPIKIVKEVESVEFLDSIFSNAQRK